MTTGYDMGSRSTGAPEVRKEVERTDKLKSGAMNQEREVTCEQQREGLHGYSQAWEAKTWRTTA